MSGKTTLNKLYIPLMNAPTMIAGRCFICGRRSPLNEHHIVFRSAGKLFIHGREVPKPTITLCGFGNNAKDANGRWFCHGKAHHGMLHFRWMPKEQHRTAMFDYTLHGAGHLEYIEFDKPTKYLDALKAEGWKRVRLLEDEEQ